MILEGWIVEYEITFLKLVLIQEEQDACLLCLDIVLDLKSPI